MRMWESGPNVATTVVVGVDGSPESIEAARFAAEEAALRCPDLVVVHACLPPSSRKVLEPGPAEAAADAAGQRLVDETLAQVRVAPKTVVHTVVRATPAAPLLVAEARGAAFIALGQHQLDLSDGRLVGQVAPQVAGNARCPVVVVPAGWSRTSALDLHHGPHPVVAGVSGRSPATAVLRMAYEEAELRRAPVLIFHASSGARSSAADRAATERDVAEIVAGQRGDHPDVLTDYRFTPSPTVLAWVEASAQARLLVVGRPPNPHGHGRRAWQHSVARAMLQRSHCPLVVVPSDPQLVLASDKTELPIRVLLS